MELLNNVDFDVLYNVTWALAKCADFKIPDDPIQFFLENSRFLPIDHVEVIVDLAMGSMITTKEIKASPNK